MARDRGAQAALFYAFVTPGIIVPLLFIFGWVSGHAGIVNPTPAFGSMYFATALGILLCAVSALLVQHNRTYMARFLSSIAIAFMVAFILEYALHVDFGIDRIFYHDGFLESDVVYPGRPSMLSAIAIASLSAAIFLLCLAHKNQYILTGIESLAVFALMLGFVSLAGHITGLPKSIGLHGWKTMSLYTSFCLTTTPIAVCMLTHRISNNAHSAPSYVAASLFIMAATLNVYTPLGIIAGFAYMPFVLSALAYRNPYTGLYFVIISTLFGIIGIYMASSILTELWIAITNRVISIVGLWILALLTYQIKVREQELVSQQHYLSSVLDNTVDGMITINEQGIIDGYNKACETIFGYSRNEVMGRNIKMLMPPHYAKHHDQYLKNYHDTGERKIIGIGREVEAQKKDGTVFPIDLSIAEVPLSGGVKMFNGIVRDITERKKTEEELIRSNMELERFAYVASHDLQEPLRMIANFTQLLQEEYGKSADPQVREYMTFIIEAARRMQAMIADLLEYSRIGYEDSGLEKVNTQSSVRMALENLKEVISQTDAKVVIGDLPTVHANPIRFLRLIQNLIGNGIKYRAHGTKPMIEIRAEMQAASSLWLFSVKDNGIGIKQEYLEQVFMMFRRLHGKNEYQGTGIGLAVCKRIVHNMGGSIWAESEFGKGSTFYFTVPFFTSKENQNVPIAQTH